MSDTTPQLIGQRLLKRGFRDWFLYLFRVVNGTSFIIEPFHEKLFAVVQEIIELKKTRICINIFPRSAKTTFAIYLCVYSMLVNPRSQIIYTSFNQQLLKQVARQIAQIMQHPVFMAMYPVLCAQAQEIDDDPISEFWREYVMKETGKPVFTSTRIITPSGGLIYLASIGSALTGLGSGSRTSDKFSGFLLLDDPDQPTQVRSETIRNKTQTYFTETLLSRLNSPQTPIINIQQRVHIKDLSSFLYEKYNFESLVFPLLDENGECISPSQYTPERVKELQVDNYVWQAQYMQQPIWLGGNLIHRDWWRYYQPDDGVMYRRIFITADTANKTREWNDYTAIGVWGVTIKNRLRLLDVVHAKLEIPELQATFIALWEKWQGGIGTCRCSAIYIEDKASGTQVIQQLRRVGGLPILPVKVDKDKVERVNDAIPQIVAGNVELPYNDKYPMTAEFLAETDAFSSDGSALHDDQVDMMTMAVSEAFNQRGYF